MSSPAFSSSATWSAVARGVAVVLERIGELHPATVTVTLSGCKVGHLTTKRWLRCEERLDEPRATQHGERPRGTSPGSPGFEAQAPERLRTSATVNRSLVRGREHVQRGAELAPE